MRLVGTLTCKNRSRSGAYEVEPNPDKFVLREVVAWLPELEDALPWR
jgi:hypothetical protein